MEQARRKLMPDPHAERSMETEPGDEYAQEDDEPLSP